MSSGTFAFVALVCLISLIAIGVYLKKSAPKEISADKSKVAAPPKDWTGTWAHSKLGPGWVKVIKGYSDTQEHLYYSHQSYKFIGFTEATMDSINLLPSVSEGKPVLFVNKDTIFAWTGEYWVAVNTGSGEVYPNLLHQFKYAGEQHYTNDAFYITELAAMPEEYLDYEQELFDWAYKLEPISAHLEPRNIITHLLCTKYNVTRNYHISLFTENLTRARTSVVITMAEEVIDLVLEDSPYIGHIRAELEQRRRNMETIVKTKELLFN